MDEALDRPLLAHKPPPAPPTGPAAAAGGDDGVREAPLFAADAEAGGDAADARPSLWVRQSRSGSDLIVRSRHAGVSVQHQTQFARVVIAWTGAVALAGGAAIYLLESNVRRFGVFDTRSRLSVLM
jgi:hypothetical protein